MNEALYVALFWGTWLLIPAVTDGLGTLWNLLVSGLVYWRKPQHSQTAELPRVSIIIPAHNEEYTIGPCLASVKAQTYPHTHLEVIVVDDGSDDNTSDVVLSHIQQGANMSPGLQTCSVTIPPQRFHGTLNLIRREQKANHNGKPAAVNAGLAQASGDIIITLDSDVVLEPDAVEQAVRAFVADDRLVAATRHLVIDPYLVHETDSKGVTRLDAYGRPVPKRLSFGERILTACQSLEYATAFHLGRRTESQIGVLFTLSGACAIFRREAILAQGGYRGRTVSEDTDLTMAMQRMPGKKVGYLDLVRVHLAPETRWSALYAQRLRWQRGALEVSAVNLKAQKKRNNHWFYWRVALPLRLQVDHTMALPRLAWTFLIFVFPLFGYSWSIIWQALGLLGMFYLLADSARTLATYMFSTPPEKVLIRQHLRFVPLLPAYNNFLFWTRISAVLWTLTEDASWTVQHPVLQSLETLDLQREMRRLATVFFSLFS